MVNYISSYLSDPRRMLMLLLLALPGRLLAISCHECAHAWMADRCGDPTAKNMGRLTINPFRHLDLLGTLMMALIGFGWARPVPVNPRNYRNFRKDDLKVSLAGIAANVILFFAGYIILVLISTVCLKRIPAVGSAILAKEDPCITQYMGEQVLISGNYYLPIGSIWQFVSSSTLSDMLVVPVFGKTVGYLYQMLVYFVEVNIVLAIFNLLPVPPLDGYHVVNDITRGRTLFASQQAGRIGYGVLLLLAFTGLLGTGLSYVIGWIYGGLGAAVNAVVALLGLF